MAERMSQKLSRTELEEGRSLVRFGAAVGRPTPLWLSVSGLAMSAGLAAFAAEAGGRPEAAALLTAAAAAGGLGVFGLAEWIGQRRRARGGDVIDSFRLLLDDAPEIAALVDRSGRIRAMNRAAEREARRRGLRPGAASDLLFDARDPQKVVFDVLGAAFSAVGDDGEQGSRGKRAYSAEPRLTTSSAAEQRVEGGRLVSAAFVGQGLALWRVRAAPAGGADRAELEEAVSQAQAGGRPPRGRRLASRTAPVAARVSQEIGSQDTPALPAPIGGAIEDAVSAVSEPLGGSAAAVGVAWFRIGMRGRVVSASPLFTSWIGSRAGHRPSLASLLPDLARAIESANAAEGEVSVFSRLIGVRDAPRAVNVTMGRDGAGPELFCVAAPLPDSALGLVGLEAAPLALGAPADQGERRIGGQLLDAFDALPAERVVSEAAIGVIAISPEGRMLRLNAAADRLMTDRANARSTAEVVGPTGDHLIDWIAEEDREQVEARLSAAAAGGATAFEARLISPDGGDGRLVQCFLSGVDSGAGRLVLCHMIDASEQRGLEQSFIQSQKLQAVGQLAGGIAHDFNNLLTVILGGAETQLRRLTEDDPAYEDLNAVYQAGRRAAWLVGQLLAFSRKQTLTPKVVDLTERCSEIVILLHRVIGERYQIVTEMEERLWPAEVDVNQFEQVITNLVVNASHAMKQGGEIRLTTANERVAKPRSQGNFTMPAGEYVRITVEDRGCGIAPEAMVKIFEPFFTTKPEGKGTGLGLAVVYGVVKQSNGFVFVDSEVDRGTVFTIYLPRVSQAEVKARGEGLTRAVERRGHAQTPDLPPPPEAARPAAGAGGASTLPSDVRAAAALLTGKAAAGTGAAEGPAKQSTKPQPPPSVVVAETRPIGLARAGAVLLIEDQAAVRAFAARTLAERGHKVIEAESGAEALEALRDSSLHIDLMLSDVVLEDMDGPSVLREIGSERPEMRVIFMSGYARDAFAETLDSASAHEREAQFLQKPFSLEELATAVEEALGRD